MNLIVVSDKRTRNDFFNVAKQIYKGDPNWVCPLQSELESTFDPEVNPEFKDGEAIRWVLKNNQGKLIGRIAAFYNRRKSKVYDQPTGGIGYFECINDKEAAHYLFDTAKSWLKDKGLEAMDGSINFGENDMNWGVLVEGFMQQGIGMPYNHPYYQELFESYGFKTYFEQYSYHRDVSSVKTFPERFLRIAERVASRPGYSFKHFRFAEQDKYIADLVNVYNTTWSRFKEHFTPMDPDEIRKSMRKSKPIIDEELVWFAYHEDKPIAFFILFPDFNQILKHLNGKMNLISMIKFLYYKSTKKMSRMRALVAGVVPEYQNKGIESAIFKQLFDVFQRKPHYKELELSWVGDYNPKMRAIYEAIGAKLAKKHITYRYIFNPEAPFKRYMEEVAVKFHGENQ